MTRYTTERLMIESLKDPGVAAFIVDTADHLNAAYGYRFNWTRINLPELLRSKYCVICKRDQEPVGLMVSSLLSSTFDPDVRILRQETLFAKPGTRAIIHLMLDFIDFGKNNANHLITMIGQHSNLTDRSLQRLGFSYLETLYRMET